jgi:hypothetical protein
MTPASRCLFLAILQLSIITPLFAQHAIKFEAKLHREGAVADLAKADDDKSIVFSSYELIPGRHASSGVVTMQLPKKVSARTLDKLLFLVRLGGSSDGITVDFQLFDHGAQKWVTVDSTEVNNTFADAKFAAEDVLSAVETKTNQVPVKLYCKHNKPFNISIDRMLFKGVKAKLKK